MPRDDDIPAEIDFSDGKRGKFFQANVELKLPVYPGNGVQMGVSRLAGELSRHLGRGNDKKYPRYRKSEVSPFSVRQYISIH